MQTNSMKQALARGETQVGVWINMVRNPAILRLMQSAGLDFARFDMEHASPSMETLSNMALLARAMNLPSRCGRHRATASGSRASLTPGSGVCTCRRWTRRRSPRRW